MVIKMKRYSIIFLLIFFGCASNKNFRQIKFGEGGGVTGNITEYTVNSKGELFKKMSLNTEQQKIGKITNDKLKDIIKRSEAVCKNDTIFKPGNYYYFIDVEMKSCRKNFVWSNTNGNSKNDLEEFYNYLNNSIIKH